MWTPLAKTKVLAGLRAFLRVLELSGLWLLEEPPFLGPRPLPLSHSQQGGPLLPPPLWFSPLPLGLLLTRQGKVLLLRADWAHLEIQGNLSTSRPKFLIPKATSLCQVR